MRLEAGADGLIHPRHSHLKRDGIIKEYAENTRDWTLISFGLAPNTSNERMKLADENSQGFVYCVSVTGVTGARDGEEV
ncbi:MAG: tryptophan synthase subunit alpha [Gracilimonas sp.]|nr:tryptophan synthase subunit alpha [Gracilimonas sp.]